ncbi:DUF3304 domain-containing protein [Oxalobacteraceae bacterium A2-2]
MKLVGTMMASIAVVLLCSCSTLDDQENYSYAAPIVGVHHLGKNFSINVFFLNKGGGGNVDRYGGGTGYLCCILIPKKWHNHLTAEVRWNVREWEEGQPKIKKETIYIATVPVEAYEKVHAVYVHFLKGGKVRVTPSFYTPRNPMHPIQPEKLGEDLATTGKEFERMFSDAELEVFRKEREKSAAFR